MTVWALLDYGGVLCHPQPAEDRSALLRAGGGDPADPVAGEAFWAGYWAYRDAYDRADLEPAGYWRAVLGRPVEPDDVEELNRLDAASWLHPMQETLAVVGELARRGTRLALLSNAPEPLAAAIDAVDWLDLIEQRHYSSRLRTAKPDPEIYLQVLSRLGAAPEEVTFVDDRADNVAGAAALGLTALRFTDARALAVDFGLDPLLVG